MSCFFVSNFFGLFCFKKGRHSCAKGLSCTYGEHRKMSFKSGKCQKKKGIEGSFVVDMAVSQSTFRHT